MDQGAGADKQQDYLQFVTIFHSWPWKSFPSKRRRRCISCWRRNTFHDRNNCSDKLPCRSARWRKAGRRDQMGMMRRKRKRKRKRKRRPIAFWLWVSPKLRDLWASRGLPLWWVPRGKWRWRVRCGGLGKCDGSEWMQKMWYVNDNDAFGVAVLVNVMDLGRINGKTKKVGRLG